MFDLLVGGLNYVFLGGRVLKLVKNRVDITNSTNPAILIININITVIDCCALPPVRLIAYCLGTSAIIVTFISSPSLVTIGSAIHLVAEIYDNY